MTINEEAPQPSAQRDIRADALPTLQLLIGFTQVSSYYLLPQSVDASFILSWSHCRIYPSLLSPPLQDARSCILLYPIICSTTNRWLCNMRRGLLLVTLFLMVKLRCSQSRCEEPGTRRSTSDNLGLDNLKRTILKRYNDLDYDSFVGLMGRRNADENAVQQPQKREMHDIFVGLMGRRNSEPDNGPWRREYPERRGVFLNKCRLRFLQGL